ncbi:zinc-dependent metalloprotease family protein [Pelagibaculum spongiae]|uniref:Metalloprotease StcE beta-sandwich domain-containing protein n=1 Tax=Pelagibaculum spongiae TaxID=2080658 RepID=A0A2V1GR11_9GAMM|nr:zinc-dependent metalloprotease family protein [Pelagibaculum spongiae]PVZ66662.1 hypothetical protein DC094_15445 [Pelagibaculum spongiae]
MKTFLNFQQRVGLMFLLLLSSSTSWAINLTPNSNNVINGQIPGIYSEINFSTYDRNWINDIKLPPNAQIGTTIRISSNTTAPSAIRGVFTGISGLTKDVSIPLLEGQSYLFTKRSGDWDIHGDTVVRWSPNSIGSQLPVTDATIIIYFVSNHNWTSSISFPASAPKDALLIVASQAYWDSSFNDTGVLVNANRHAIKYRDLYMYQYDTDEEKWSLVIAPVRSLAPNALLNGHEIPRPTSPLTVLSLGDGSWTGRTTLPTQAFDRDRVRITSTATWQSQISHQGVEDNIGSLSVNRGDVYEFMYAGNEQEWKLLKSPVTRYLVRDLPYGSIPPLITPNMRVSAYNDNWRPVVRLSRHATNGDRITIASDANLEFKVTASDSPLLGEVFVNRGDEIQFLRTDNRWVRATETISMLLAYSDAVANSLGENGARARMYESFRLTNAALRNSNVNARLKLAGIIKMTVPGNDAGNVVYNMARSESEMLRVRLELEADSVFYLGVQTGACGLAYRNHNALSYYGKDYHRNYMVALGRLGCGTSVMRHEFGHNMGLEHCNGGQNGYGHGYKGSVMCGNRAPYYSSPNFYNDLLLPRGIENQHDAVRVINENAPVVSNFFQE